MGTTQVFLFIRSSGYPPEKWQEKLQGFASQKGKANQSLFARIAALLKLPQISDISGEAILAWRENAQWIPFFETCLCEGNISNAEQLISISAYFGAPILGFSIYDSDYLIVSYADAASMDMADYVKSNFGDDPDDEMFGHSYKSEFPEFLLRFIPAEEHDRLREIWSYDAEVFADDRMIKILTLLDTVPIYDGKSAREDEDMEKYRLFSSR